jgi:hypothetical protein
LTRAAAIKFPCAGNVRAVSGSNTAVTWSCFSQLQLPELEFDVVGFDADMTRASQTAQSSTSLADFISQRLTDLHQQDLTYRNPSVVSPMRRRLSEIHQSMHYLDFFSFEDESCLPSTESILFHWDLEPQKHSCEVEIVFDKRWWRHRSSTPVGD